MPSTRVDEFSKTTILTQSNIFQLVIVIRFESNGFKLNQKSSYTNGQLRRNVVLSNNIDQTVTWNQIVLETEHFSKKLKIKYKMESFCINKKKNSKPTSTADVAPSHYKFIIITVPSYCCANYCAPRTFCF